MVMTTTFRYFPRAVIVQVWGSYLSMDKTLRAPSVASFGGKQKQHVFGLAGFILQNGRGLSGWYLNMGLAVWVGPV